MAHQEGPFLGKRRSECTFEVQVLTSLLGTGSVESPEYVVGPARKAIHEVVRERKKLAVLKKNC